MMKRAFTLVELLVVVGMIAIITGAVGASVSGARARAREMKALAEVKEMTNAILAYENYSRNGRFELPTMEGRDADMSSVGFILGHGGSIDSGDNKVPVLYNGSVSSDGTIRDPWGTPYKVTIRQGSVQSLSSVATKDMCTGYFMPNYYRLSLEERNR